MAKASKSTPSASSSQMKAAWKLFDAGDKVAARREAEKVLASSPSDVDAAEARDLLARLKVPQIGLFLAAAAFVAIIVMILLARSY